MGCLKMRINLKPRLWCGTPDCDYNVETHIWDHQDRMWEHYKSSHYDLIAADSSDYGMYKDIPADKAPYVSRRYQNV